jgi:GNAT superfamily N-acetyltransferase
MYTMAPTSNTNVSPPTSQRSQIDWRRRPCGVLACISRSRASQVPAGCLTHSVDGTSLSDWQGESDRESCWRNRLDDVPFNVVAAVDGCPVGQVSGTDLDDRLSVELISMWAAPISRGTGIGEALIDAVVGWAEGIGRDAFRSRSRTRTTCDRALRASGFVDRGVSADTPDERTMTRLVATSWHPDLSSKGPIGRLDPSVDHEGGYRTRGAEAPPRRVVEPPRTASINSVKGPRGSCLKVALGERAVTLMDQSGPAAALNPVGVGEGASEDPPACGEHALLGRVGFELEHVVKGDH